MTVLTITLKDSSFFCVGGKINLSPQSQNCVIDSSTLTDEEFRNIECGVLSGFITTDSTPVTPIDYVFSGLKYNLMNHKWIPQDNVTPYTGVSQVESVNTY